MRVLLSAICNKFSDTQHVYDYENNFKILKNLCTISTEIMKIYNYVLCTNLKISCFSFTKSQNMYKVTISVVKMKVYFPTID